MKIYTPRTLVREVIGAHSLTQPRLNQAVGMLQLAGWVLNHHPTVEMDTQPVPAVRRYCNIAPLMKVTYEASRSGRRPAWVAIDGAEEITAHSIDAAETGDVLGRHGLVVQGLRQQEVGLVGTSPMLAKIVNRTRLGLEQRGGWSSQKLVQAALGLDERPARLTAKRRVEAADVLEQYEVDASDLLNEEKKRVQLRSKWTFVELMQSA